MVKIVKIAFIPILKALTIEMQFPEKDVCVLCIYNIHLLSAFQITLSNEIKNLIKLLEIFYNIYFGLRFGLAKSIKDLQCVCRDFFDL